MNRIRVCYVTHEPNMTGASQSLLDLLDGLDREHIEPVVLLRKRGPLEKELKNRNIRYEIIYYTQTIRPYDRRELLRSTAKRIVNAYQERKIRNFFRKESFDVIHNNSTLVISGMKAARKAGVPYICHIRDLFGEVHTIAATDKKGLFKCIRQASAVITISNYVLSEYEKIISKDKSHLIYDGVRIDRYFKKHNYLFENKMTKALVAGRIQENKHQLDAVKAVEMLNEEDDSYELYVVGGDAPSTDYPDKMREYVKNINSKRIHLYDHMELDELRAECDIALMCSLNDAFGRVTVEGMLAGCLVIGASAGATPEIIEDGKTGYLYEANNFKALAECIKKARHGKSASNEIALQGQKHALAYDSKEYAEKITRIYEKVIGETR